MEKDNELYESIKTGVIPSPKLRTSQLLGLKDKYSYSQMYDKSRYAFLLDAPFRISNKCRLRESKWMKYGCNAFDQKGHPTSAPLSFWTEQDILRYIERYKLDIADIYGDIRYMDEDGMLYDNELFDDSMLLTTTGEKRTGCVFCMFGITQDTDRFLRLKEQEPKKYDYILRGGKFDEDGMWIPHQGLGYKFVIDWLNENGDLGIKY